MRTVLAFDYDGLIVDTESTSFQAWQRVFLKYGCELRLDTWLLAVGTYRDFDPKAVLEAHVGHSLPSVYDEKYEIHLQLDAEVPLRDGVRDLLALAREHDCKVGVVSNSPRWWIETGLRRRGVADLFDVIISKEDVPEHKPDPRSYRALLNRLSGTPDRSIAFEDSAPGVLAARLADYHVVAVPNPITRHSDLSSADLVLDSLSDLPASWLLSRILQHGVA